MKEDPNHQACLPVYITCLVSLKKSQRNFLSFKSLVDNRAIKKNFVQFCLRLLIDWWILIRIVRLPGTLWAATIMLLAVLRSRENICTKLQRWIEIMEQLGW